MGTIKKKRNLNKYKPKQKNEIRLSSYIRKHNYELGESVRDNKLR